MLRRFVAPLVFACASCVLVVACGGATPRPSAPVAPTLPAVGNGDSGAGAPSAKAKAEAGRRRGASDALKKAWPFEAPAVVVYAELDGLMHTKVMAGLSQGILGLAATQLTPSQKKCLDDGFANVKELAVGAEDAGVVVMARIDPANANWLGTCVLGAFKDSKPMKLAGAAEAWSLRTDVAALSPDRIFLLGPRAQVERGLAGRGSGASLASVTLADGEYVAWTASVFDDQPPAHGSVLATDERFRIAGEADLPSEKLAGEVEHELATSSLSAQIPRSGLSAEDTQGLGRLVKALGVKRDRRHVAIALDLREPPADQARDLGAAAALAVYGVRSYIVNAKLAEARNTLGQIAKGIVTLWEMETPDGKPQAKKKLVSFPAVPKTVPKGVKYQSSPADWKPWAPLRFEMSAPQYFQYEVKAAKDGESAEIIARGDLDGNGKASELELVVKVERPSNVIRVSPSIHEIDPNE